MEKKVEEIYLEERSDIGGNYLVAIGCEEGDYREEMLKNSKIEGLLPVNGQDFDGRHELWFTVGEMQPLSVKFRQNAPGTAVITELMRQIENLAVKLEEYLLEPKEIGLALSWIFEGEDGEYLFLYLPGYAKKGGGICRLLEELMEYVDYENHRAVSFLYLLHAKARQQTGGGFALYRLCGEILRAEQEKEQEREQDDFFAEFDRTNGEEDQTEKNRIKKMAKPGMDKRKETEENRKKRGKLGAKTDSENFRGKASEKKNSQNAEKEKKKIKKQEKKQEENSPNGKFSGWLNKFVGLIKGEENNSAFEEENDFAFEENEYISALAEEDNYDKKSEDAREREYNLETGECAETVLLGGEELTQTVLLSSDRGIVDEEQYYLISEEGGRIKIYLSANPFCIGKGEGCDYVLKEPVISRHHAKILKEGESYFLVDTDSLNGTYLNGRKLAAHTRAEIKKGDRIDFADLSFRLESDRR